jgi:hypothetical protein
MNCAHNVDVDGGAILRIVETEPDDDAASTVPSPEEIVAAAAVHEEIAAWHIEPWAPWITAAAVAQVVAKGGPDNTDVSAVVLDEMTKREPYEDLFAAIPDPNSKAGVMLRALVSRIVSPVGVHFIGGNKVCDVVPRIAPGETEDPPHAQTMLPWLAGGAGA